MIMMKRRVEDRAMGWRIGTERRLYLVASVAKPGNAGETMHR